MTSFSYEETNTGLTWLDGRPIYQRSFNWNNPSNLKQYENNTGNILEEHVSVINSIVIVERLNTINHFNNYNTFVDKTTNELVVSWPIAQVALVPNTAIITIWYIKEI